MDFFGNLVTGFNVALQPYNLIFCFVGVFIGTLIGVLPGIGPVGTIAILLPVTFGISPATAIIMLAGIYYGAQYGGSTTSILVNIPGEAASVITTLDGYQMALKGRAGPALGIAAFGSFIAGTLAVIGLQALAPLLVSVALRFGPPEYFSLLILAFVLLTYLTRKSMIKALMMAGVGVLLGGIGLDIITGMTRFTLDIPELLDGIGLAPLAMGLFGISEILLNLEREIKQTIVTTKVKGLFPTRKDWAQTLPSIFRGTGIGFFLGLLPGGGALISSFLSYAVEKRVSRHPENFGKGAIEGVAGPESANNAATSAQMIPLLALGLPFSAAPALLLAALMIQGVQPGPLLIQDRPEVFWGVIASMYVGNVMLLGLNLPLIAFWVRLLTVPYRFLSVVIVITCVIGAYSVNNSVFDIGTMVGFGVIGYLMRKGGFPAAPMILAIILCPLLERNVKRAFIMSGGDLLIFFRGPISTALLALAGFLIFIPFIKWFWRRWFPIK